MIIILNWILGIIIGFSLCSIWNLRKLKKIQKKTGELIKGMNGEGWELKHAIIDGRMQVVGELLLRNRKYMNKEDINFKLDTPVEVCKISYKYFELPKDRKIYFLDLMEEWIGTQRDDVKRIIN